MQINGAVAFVSGGNRGLGRQFVQTLLDRGASKVYAAARNPDTITTPGVVRVALDVTDPASVRAAADLAQDVTLLINNAGSSTRAGLPDGDIDDFRLEMETHYFGTLAMSRAFAPSLARNGGGAVLNVLSVLSWITFPGDAAYSAAKSAAWSLTNALRVQLSEQKTLVTGLHVGYMDTDMAAHVDGPKSDPAKVAHTTLDGVEAGRYEVLADEISSNVRAALSGDLSALYPQLTATP
ncbi:SDR family oxidoreductase [Streptosporangium lutulentum]|uniref:NAD(P)-dependent dehydrogenase (Short-subunit alcohol dehydrogenase family) n=1 Tax=Streptosporangium lutulentum TaxID=1461250 RepID=A0ABT9Q6T3_9ACTN|nr:SDR family oxidoreductase [Streptosporangium lutulentum]MDP9842105.1 NAD(P)-dependent dehydrogenase (short-subunit alcohol dehydrogenase family) [Streptosporangium lutulentum]